MNSLGSTLIQNNFTALLEVIIIPTLFIIGLRRISHSCKQLIANRYQIHGQIFFGWLGIMIHEFSHLVVAIVFGHKITGFRLLHIPSGPTDNQLGYVNHTYNPKNSYQRMGNLFIGIAPIFGCAIALIVATKLLNPALLVQFQQLPELNFSWSMFNLSNIWQLLLLILIASNIAVGGFDLSDADLQHTKFGLLALVVLVIIATSFATLLGVDAQYLNWLHAVSTIVDGSFFFSLVIAMLSNGLIRLITSR
ncbi:hypothetical protein ACYATM_02765 [Lactobacillaceae bacterium Scapto_B20]